MAVGGAYQAMSVPPQNFVVVNYMQPSELPSRVHNAQYFSVFSQRLLVFCQASSREYRFFRIFLFRNSQTISHFIRAPGNPSHGAVRDRLHQSRDILKISRLSRSAKGDARGVNAARYRIE